MSDPTSEDQEKIDEYLRLIQERILAPIQKTKIRHYCTATLLLLFAAIDGLGKLLHRDKNAKAKQRILGFLDYMGGDYRAHKEDLQRLRNSLVHNAINVGSFLSHTETDLDRHLKKMGTAGFIYVNTMVMYEDFVKAFGRFHSDIQHDPAMMKRAADRLEWREDSPLDDLDAPTPSPPPPVEFTNAR